ncbi:MAG: hypothetical protein EBX95_14260, partial [Acidimicrobiia bacterium]|nr:hypothetical protein [Acidimicrobiia bacterium]
TAAMSWGERLGVEVDALMVMRRVEAMEDEVAHVVRKADAVWLVGDNPIHLRSVIKDTPIFDALQHVLKEGGVVVGSGGTGSGGTGGTSSSTTVPGTTTESTIPGASGEPGSVDTSGEVTGDASGGGSAIATPGVAMATSVEIDTEGSGTSPLVYVVITFLILAIAFAPPLIAGRLRPSVKQ